MRRMATAPGSDRAGASPPSQNEAPFDANSKGGFVLISSPFLLERIEWEGRMNRAGRGFELGFAYASCEAFALVLTPMVFFNTSSVPMTSTKPIARQIHGLRTNPAMTKQINEMAIIVST